MPGSIKIGFWNTQGYNHKQLGNKLKLQEVKNIVNKHHIFGIVETHANVNSDLHIEAFKHYTKIRDKSGLKQHGGINVYIHNRIKEGTVYVPTNNKNIIWCKLMKNFFQIPKDIFVGTVYFSPNNYEKNQLENYILDLEEKTTHFSKKGEVILAR